jgi:hypothetical protein
MDMSAFRNKRAAAKAAKPLKDKDLTYSASARCDCGAGLAYGGKRPSAWDCSDILTGRAVPSGQPGAVTHSDLYPFVFWKIKSERSGLGSTRP